MNGTKALVPGNHDYCWHGLWGNKPEKRARWEAAYGEFFTIFHEPLTIHLSDGVEYRLNHFPYQGDSHDEDRYASHRPEDDGMPLLHGHIHDLWITQFSEAGTLMVNVGVDVHGFRPISEDELLNIVYPSK